MNPDSPHYKDWLEKAANDLLAAKGILNYYEEPPTDTVCYHAQQAAEKALKGFLIARAQPLPRTHDLVELLNRAKLAERGLSVKLAAKIFDAVEKQLP